MLVTRTHYDVVPAVLVARPVSQASPLYSLSVKEELAGAVAQPRLVPAVDPYFVRQRFIPEEASEAVAYQQKYLGRHS